MTPVTACRGCCKAAYGLKLPKDANAIVGRHHFSSMGVVWFILLPSRASLSFPFFLSLSHRAFSSAFLSLALHGYARGHFAVLYQQTGIARSKRRQLALFDPWAGGLRLPLPAYTRLRTRACAAAVALAVRRGLLQRTATLNTLLPSSALSTTTAYLRLPPPCTSGATSTWLITLLLVYADSYLLDERELRRCTAGGVGRAGRRCTQVPRYTYATPLYVPPLTTLTAALFMALLRCFLDSAISLLRLNHSLHHLTYLGRTGCARADGHNIPLDPISR